MTGATGDLYGAAALMGPAPWSPGASPSGLGAILLALLVAGAALYLPGLALGQLFPAPARGRQEFRVAVAPLLSIVIAGIGVRVLALLGIPLHAGQLVALTLLLWAVVWWRRTRGAEPDPLPGSGTDHLGLAVQLAVGAALWVASLVPTGLALPNRDFKNHVVFVAQIAASDSIDPDIVLRTSPVAEPSAGGLFYPLGLHALLAWALPVRTGSTVGLTAAAAVLVTLISLPLAVRTLCRMWRPQEPRLPWLAGLCAVVLPGATAAAFTIGSVVLMAGVALYAAGLCSLWLWLRDLRVGSTMLLGLAGVGLFWLHVAEAVGLLLVACGAPLLAEARVSFRSRRRATIIALVVTGVGLAVAMALLRDELTGLFGLRDLDWDLEPNDYGPFEALIGTVGQQPVPLSPLSSVWWGLALGGLYLGHRRGWSGFPGWALTVPVLLSMAATMTLPTVLTAVTAPWYGTSTRAMLLAFPVLVVVASAAVLAVLDLARSRMLRAAVLVVAVLLVLASAINLVPNRRNNLAASLAGVGDTPAIAELLATELQAGETVLNLESDGTALLFAYSRVPVLSTARQELLDQPIGGVPLAERLLELDDPAVAARLAALDVRFIALGTANRYWGQNVGYDWRSLAAQPDVQLVARGDQVVLLRYLGGAS